MQVCSRLERFKQRPVAFNLYFHMNLHGVSYTDTMTMPLVEEPYIISQESVTEYLIEGIFHVFCY